MLRSTLLLKRMFLKMVVAAVLCSAATSARADGSLPHCYGLGIGQTKHDHNGALVDSVKNARAVGDMLRKQEGLLFAKVDWQNLEEEKANRSNILAGLDRVAAQAKAGDSVVVYLLLHGMRIDNEWWFMDYDGNLVPGRDLVERLAPLTRRGVKVVLILESCHSGAAQQTLYPYLNAGAGEGGFIVFLSSLPAESSMGGKNSVFCRAWLDGMAGAADLNGDGRITLAELNLYIRQRAQQLVRENPALKARMPGMPFVFEQYTDCVHSPNLPDSLTLARVAPGAGRETGQLGSTSRSLVGQKAAFAGAGHSFKGKWKVQANGKSVGLFVFDSKIPGLKNAPFEGLYAARLFITCGGKTLKLFVMGFYRTRGNVLILLPLQLEENEPVQKVFPDQDRGNVRDEVPVTWLSPDKFQLTFQGVKYTFEREKIPV